MVKKIQQWVGIKDINCVKLLVKKIRQWVGIKDIKGEGCTSGRAVGLYDGRAGCLYWAFDR